MATKFTVQQSGFLSLLLLKHAKGFHGGDLAVAHLLTHASLCTEAQIRPRVYE